MECSYRHKLRHIDKIDLSTPSVNLVFGTACHEMVEQYLKTKVIDPTPGIVLLETEWEKYKEAEDFVKADKASYINSLGMIMLDVPTFLNETFPGWELIEAEENLYEEMKQFYEQHDDVSFKGFIDAVLKVPTKGREGPHAISFIQEILGHEAQHRHERHQVWLCHPVEAGQAWQAVSSHSGVGRRRDSQPIAYGSQQFLHFGQKGYGDQEPQLLQILRLR
jgi:PD-(D/E)XK nuclease superfamily